MKAVYDFIFSPIQIGSVQLPHRLIQGPLAGYSCAPFRVITNRYGEPAFCSTEMISSKDLVCRNPNPTRFLWRDPSESILSYQLSGNDPQVLAHACEIVSRAGADIIDLNCGCPVKKIRSKSIGSKLLAQPEMIYDAVRAMKAHTDAAITVKMRVGEPKHDSDDRAVAQAAQAAGADALTVHGRHWTERYDVPCRLSAIRQVVEAVSIPVFANGDVEDTQSLIQTVQATNCAGVMIARASVGEPWLFKRIRAELQGISFQEPTIETRAKVFLEHIQGLATLENEKLAVLQSRKLAKYYSRYWPDRKAFVLQVQQATQLQTVIDLSHQSASIVQI